VKALPGPDSYHFLFWESGSQLCPSGSKNYPGIIKLITFMWISFRQFWEEFEIEIMSHFEESLKDCFRAIRRVLEKNSSLFIPFIP